MYESLPQKQLEIGGFGDNRKQKGEVTFCLESPFFLWVLLCIDILNCYSELIPIFLFAISVRFLSAYVNTPSGCERKFLIQIPSIS